MKNLNPFRDDFQGILRSVLKVGYSFILQTSKLTDLVLEIRFIYEKKKQIISGKTVMTWKKINIKNEINIQGFKI